MTGLSDLTVAINLSPRQFADAMLLPKLTRIIQSSGLDPSNLELEITESVVIYQRLAVLEKLKSLAYPKRFSIDTIKMDRSFIREIPADAGDINIARAIFAMAHCPGGRGSSVPALP